MGETKTTFRFYTIFQWRQEEEYLTKMHCEGWKFRKVTFPGFYSFDKCGPENVSYRLDYNQEGLKQKDEYVRMFEDCGWEHLQDFFGYSYFRKEVSEGLENEEIFGDEASRLEMMKRVFRGRLLLAVVLFFVLVIPQFLMSLSLSAGETASKVRDVLTFLWVAIALIYIVTFLVFVIQYHRYAKRAYGDDRKLRWKFIGLYLLIFLFAAGVVLCTWYTRRSVYTVHDTASGFVIEAEKLNKTIRREEDLKAGDVVSLNVKDVGKYVWFSLSEEGEDPVLYGSFRTSDPVEYTIQKDGCYIIEVGGRALKGTIGLDIRKAK